MPPEESSDDIPNIEPLRDIAWIWDPLELSRHRWREQGGANEYDRYVLHAFEMLKQGYSQKETAEYLVEIERKWMDLEVDSSTQDRGAQIVAMLIALTRGGNALDPQP